MSARFTTQAGLVLEMQRRACLALNAATTLTSKRDHERCIGEAVAYAAAAEYIEASTIMYATTFDPVSPADNPEPYE